MNPQSDLPKPARRKHIHTRTYRGEAFEREDGLFDVEVEMRDTKPFSYDNTDRSYIAAGEPLHHMKMRVTINEGMEIVDVEARTLASPYHMCSNITPNYKNLIGLRIVGGFTKKVQEITGRTAGCTHHNDILKIVGTTAFQGLWSIIAKRMRDRAEQESSEQGSREQGGKDQANPDKPSTADAGKQFVGRAAAQALLNTCHVYDPASPIVKREWPDFHKPNPNKPDLDTPKD